VHCGPTTPSDGQVVPSTYIAAPHDLPHPHNHHLVPAVPTHGSFVSSFSGFLPDNLPTTNTEGDIRVDARYPRVPTDTSVTEAYSVNSTLTHERRTKRKGSTSTPEDDKRGRTCGWSGTCTAKVHLGFLRYHLRVHLENVDGDRVYCRYVGCNKAVKKEGLTRHYVTHFGTRAECSGCGKDFARPDEVTRGHKTKDKIRCPSKRWRRFIVNDRGSKDYL